jgi:hypothetical protein
MVSGMALRFSLYKAGCSTLACLIRAVSGAQELVNGSRKPARHRNTA